MKKKIVIVLIIVVVIIAFKALGLGQYLTLDYLKSNLQSLQQTYNEKPFVSMLVFVAGYILMAALSLPGATILTLAGGAVFGVLTGTILVSIASTIGATCAFLVARFLLRESVQKKFGSKLESINKGVETEGAFYLFTLRLVPLFPFFVVNLVMGLTTLPTLTFAFVSQLGMLPATIVYVNAGTQIAKINTLKDVASVPLLVSFALLGIFPIVAKKIIERFRKKPQT